MSGQLKEVRIRIQSVMSTQQITKAMKMVSAAKLRRAQDAIIQMRPYSQKLSGILSNIIAGQDGSSDIEYSLNRDVKKVLIILITSDRGLCGGFNTNLAKRALALIKEEYSDLDNSQIEFLCIGKKGAQVIRKFNYAINDKYQDLITHVNFEEAAQAAEEVMVDFVGKKYDRVELVYSQFKNAAVQNFMAERFLPVAEAEDTTETNSNFIFEPSEAVIIEQIIPKILKTQFFKALLDTAASEHGARMTAMDSATENASELIRTLRISYNRARQAAITTELTEIVAGAAALEG